jgi:hypothetical protein
MPRKKNEEETSVTVQENTAVAADPLADLMEADAASFEDSFTADDLSVPFISILQRGSPQVEEDGIEGAKAGMFYNTVTNELFDGKEGIEVVYCAYSKIGVEWVPREQGGGLVAHHDLTPEFRKSLVRVPDSFRLSMPNGNSLVETAYHYVVHINKGLPEMAVVSMWSTALKASRQWNAQSKLYTVEINGKRINPPIFACKWRMRTKLMSKDTNKWYEVSAPPSPEDAEATAASDGGNVAEDGAPF